VEFGNSYSVQAVLGIFLKQMVPLAIVVDDSASIGDEPLHYFPLLLELLQNVDLEPTSVDVVIRFVDMLYLNF